MALNLSKETERNLNLRKQIVLTLAKSKGLENEKAQVVLAMDISGSMQDEYYDGTVQRVIERIVPLAMQFDDNQSIDLYLFQDQAYDAGQVTLNNLEGYVERDILRSGKYQFGGTQYAPVIEFIRDGAQNMLGKAAAAVTGMFGSIFGKTAADAKKLPTYVIFVTDGDNSDHSKTERLMRELSSKGIFWQFVGIGHAGFSFLDKLDNLSGREIDNASFFKATNIDRMSDDALYAELLKEFPTWIKQARQRGFIS